jgi:hypothetical protein
MLPPTLEVYVVWHPLDSRAKVVGSQIFDHFHGTSFSGLMGGAIEVYDRSAGWRSTEDAPRPIPFPDAPDPSGVPTAQIVAVVPVVGNEFASAIESDNAEWTQFVGALESAQRSAVARVGVFPFMLDGGVLESTKVGRLLGRFQNIATPTPSSSDEPWNELLCRDLSQGITQLVRPNNQRLTVFISHTKRAGAGEADTPALIDLVRRIIGETRLQHFFDASDLQPGADWDNELRAYASTSALLVLRTDLYATREWCQREMVIAKRHGMPVVTLDCVSVGEERGSFLMDHVPRIPLRRGSTDALKADVRRGLNLLVDECLKRELWSIQRRLAGSRSGLNVAWWAPHAPEPLTLIHWMEERIGAGLLAKDGGVIRVLHPDPPLGPDETEALQQVVRLVGHGGPLEVMTPRALASRGV